jgi:hypothetical protein
VGRHHQIHSQPQLRGQQWERGGVVTLEGTQHQWLKTMNHPDSIGVLTGEVRGLGCPGELPTEGLQQNQAGRNPKPDRKVVYPHEDLELMAARGSLPHRHFPRA